MKMVTYRTAKNRTKRGLKKLLKKSKLALIASLAAAGGWLIVTAFLDLFPTGLSIFMKVIIGLGVILLAGYISAKK